MGTIEMVTIEKETGKPTPLKRNVYPVLLAGGTGSRLWPVSRERYPKQLVNFIGKDSLVQSTIKRMAPVLDIEKVRIVCGAEYFYEIVRHMEEIGVSAEGKIISEPCGRNTAPAILLSVLSIAKTNKDAILCIFPADHVIRDITMFHERLEKAVKLAEAGYIVTFGIKPGYPETGYGYIESAQKVNESALSIVRFVEKPDRETAKEYLQAGTFFWNSGMFAFTASAILEEFKMLQPELLQKMEALVADEPIGREAYEQLPNISIDYAIMEKTEKGVVLPSDFGWSDIGSWKSLYDFLPKDENMNVIDGDVIALDTKNSFIMGHDRLIATNRLDNMVVVETPDSVFVSDINNSRDVKTIVTELKKKGRNEYHHHRTVYHPWGSIKLLEQKDDFQTDRIVLYSGTQFEDHVDGSMHRHLIVISGRVEISTAGETQILEREQTAVVAEKGALIFKNIGRETVTIIQVQVKAVPAEQHKF